jgi:hypothetical protein
MRIDSYKRIVQVLILSWSLMFVPVIEAHAQAAAATSRMGSAIAGAVRAKAARWGIAANDPRVTATIVGIETGMAVAARGTTGGGAVSWPAILAAAGIAGLVAGGIAFYNSGTEQYKWTFKPDGTIVASTTAPKNYYAPGDMPALTPIVAGKSVFKGYTTKWDPVAQRAVVDATVYASDPVVLAIMIVGYGSVTQSSCGVNGWPSYLCYISPNPNSSSPGRVGVEYMASSPVSGSTGIVDERAPLAPATSETTYSNAGAAAAAPPPASIMVKPVSNEAVAAAANTLWKNAADPNQTGGIPWSASDPITQQDVNEWVSANSGTVPTVADFLGSPAQTSSSTASAPSFSLTGGSSPSSGGGGSTAPSPTPGQTTEPSTSPVAPTTPGSGQEINWGPNPNIGAPTLEATPTKESILDPAFKLMPDLKTFAMPSHQSVCPVANFSLFGHAYSMDSHCGLFEENRGVLGAAMVLAYTIAAVRIVLKA